jgi:DNA-binding NarL/FixJ family response regulator
MDGIEVTKHIRTGYPETRVIALTTAEDEHFVRAALNAGAAAYLPKSADAEELMLAIQAVIAGRNYIHPKVAHALEAARLARRMVDLSAREAEVIRLIALGYTHKEVADQLHVSSKTVETHKSRAQQKLGVTSRVEIIRVAVERGWIMAGENARERIALALR